jgi:hypothetical protein
MKFLYRAVLITAVSLCMLHAPLSFSESIYVHIYTVYLTVGVVALANFLLSFILKD